MDGYSDYPAVVRPSETRDCRSFRPDVMVMPPCFDLLELGRERSFTSLGMCRNRSGYSVAAPSPERRAVSHRDDSYIVGKYGQVEMFRNDTKESRRG